MPSIPDLPGAIRTLARIEAAGWLEDFEVEVANATRGPSNDLERHPHYKYNVGRFARVASRVFGLGIGECHTAACEALLPSTRCGVALEILEEYDERLEQRSLEDAAQRKMAMERRRLRRA